MNCHGGGIPCGTHHKRQEKGRKNGKKIFGERRGGQILHSILLS